jgi:hypothetical protein
VQGVQEMMMARQGARKFPAATSACDWSSWRVGVVVGTDEIIGYCGKEGMRTYQGVEGDDASSVAKSVGSRWSEDSTIARRSFMGARVLTGVDELFIPTDARAHYGVWEGRLRIGVLEVVARCAGAAGVCRIRRNKAVAEAGSGERFCRPGGASDEGRRGETQRGGSGIK